MVSADDLGIRKGLIPIFCANCGCRIGWAEELGEDLLVKFCEECAKLPEEDINL